MIVVVGGIKGGSGKTTLATNLTVLRAQAGSKVLLVDADEQRSAADWAEQREGMGVDAEWTTIQLAGKTIYSELLKMGADYDEIIIDGGGRDTTSLRSALSVADIFLIPFKPRSFDVWTIRHVQKIINEMKPGNPQLVSLAVINQADSRGTDNKDSTEILKDCEELICLPISIGHRKAFANAAADGLGVVELEKEDKKASQEIRELDDYIYVKCFVDGLCVRKT